MDLAKYKDVKVSRGHTYRYYYVPASPGKPTLLFIHGFPSSSFDWSRQVAHFQPTGYGLLVPDGLGFGGTSKPANHEEFRWKLIAQDITNILDAEGLTEVIGVAHDWSVYIVLRNYLQWLIECTDIFGIRRGSVVLSRLANYHQDRFSAFIWITLSYVPPSKETGYLGKALRKHAGSEVFGYWEFFVQPNAHVVCEKNVGLPVSANICTITEHLTR